MENVEPIITGGVLLLLGLGLVILVVYLGLKLIDVFYINMFKRPLWVHFYWSKKSLNRKQQAILKTRGLILGLEQASRNHDIS